MQKRGLSVVIASVGLALVALTPSGAAARDRIKVYEHTDYLGDQRSITDDEPNLNDLDFNDIISSIRVESGTWQVCENANYRGRCRTIDGNDRNLVSSGFNDIISSIRRVRDDGRDDDRYGDDDRRDDRRDDRDHRDDGRWNRDPSWDRDSRWDQSWDRWVDHSKWNDRRNRSDITLYQDDNFNGDRRRIDGDVVNLQNIGFNDTTSSLRIRYGVWQVCVDSWYRKKCQTFDRDVRSLRDYGLNDKISSIRRIR